LSETTGPTTTEAEQSPPSLNDTVKDTIESIVIAFVLAFVFRAYVVEAFVIPTGSMAPTLLGAHVTVTCSECGYRFSADIPEEIQRGPSRRGNESAVCPMCGYLIAIKPGTRVSSGDRILVHKYIYSIVEPRRWDVVVFKAPHMPDTNFIKRLVGLPREKLMSLEGTIYTSSTDPGASEEQRRWHVERKTVRPKVQRAIWQSVYHSERVPLDGSETQNGVVRRRQAWQWPWEPVEGRWDMQNNHDYRCEDKAGGVIGFRFDNLAGFPRYAYNQFKPVNREFNREPVEDVRVAATIQAESAGLGVEISTTARWGEMNGGGKEIEG
jgi:signal peptidase I